MAPTSRCLPLHLPHPHRTLPACHTCYSPPPPYNFGPAALPVHSTRSVSLSHLALHFLLYSSSVMTSHESRFPWILPLLNSSMSLGHAFPLVLLVYVIMDFHVIQTLCLCVNTSHSSTCAAPNGTDFLSTLRTECLVSNRGQFDARTRRGTEDFPAWLLFGLPDTLDAK
jgi:hypothetical protein